MTVYTFSEARQKFASILNQAQVEGEVLIKRKDGSSFIVRPIKKIASPLNVKGVNMKIFILSLPLTPSIAADPVSPEVAPRIFI